MAAPRHAPPDAFGRTAELYERSRPGWPPAAIELLVRELGLGPGSTAADVGAGTGKLTRELVGRVGRLVAVEPDDAMRAVLARVVPHAEAVAGRAESLPLADGSVDAVVAAEAFHWFDGPAALAEFARVLRPGGGVALLWNANFRPGRGQAFEPEARPEFWAALDRGSLPKRSRDREASGLWREAFAGSAFGELMQASFPNELVLDRDGVIDHIQSWSAVAGLPEAERGALVDELRGLLDADTTYRRSFDSTVYWAQLRG